MPNGATPERTSERSAGLHAVVSTTRERDPFSFLASHAGAPRALLAAPGLVLAGAGVAAEVTARGPDRFRRIREAAARAAESLSVTHEPGADREVRPQWVGGFAFDADDDADPEFPAASFVLPSELLVVRPESSHLVRFGPTPASRPTAEAARPVDPRWAQHPAAHEWTVQVREALHEIQAGRLDKLVLSRRLESDAGPWAPLDVARRLREAAPTNTVFLFEPRAGHAWVGASPELLIERRAGRIATVALAGSRPRGTGPDEDQAYERSLLASSKDAWEHELVCRSIRGALEERGRPWQMRSDRAVLKLPYVQHLETRFESGTTPDEHLLDLAERLHPTPAVCGSPREAARTWVGGLEAAPRGWYAGAVGHFGADGDGALSVAIRCARLRPEGATLFAGCGIVNGSDPAEEWEESRTKFQTLLAALEGSP